MRIISERRIREYCDKYPEAKNWLISFWATASMSDWKHLQDLRGTYPSADAVKVRSGRVLTVINACGNRYRLVVAVHYDKRRLFIREFLTHAEYDRDKWKQRS